MFFKSTSYIFGGLQHIKQILLGKSRKKDVGEKAHIDRNKLRNTHTYTMYSFENLNELSELMVMKEMEKKF